MRCALPRPEQFGVEAPAVMQSSTWGAPSQPKNPCQEFRSRRPGLKEGLKIGAPHPGPALPPARPGLATPALGKTAAKRVSAPGLGRQQRRPPPFGPRPPTASLLSQASSPMRRLAYVAIALSPESWPGSPRFPGDANLAPNQEVQRSGCRSKPESGGSFAANQVLLRVEAFLCRAGPPPRKHRGCLPHP